MPLSFSNLGRGGLIVSFLFFFLCVALRLARFNANINKVDPNFFQGLPIPGAAFGLVGLVLLTTVLPVLRELPVVAIIYVLLFFSSYDFQYPLFLHLKNRNG